MVRLDDLGQHGQEGVALGLVSHVGDTAPGSAHEHPRHQEERLGCQRLVIARQQLRHRHHRAPALTSTLGLGAHLEERQVHAVVAAEAALDRIGHAELERLAHAHALEELLWQRRRQHERTLEAFGEGDERIVGRQVVHLVDEQERVLAERHLGEHGLCALERAEHDQPALPVPRFLGHSSHGRPHLLQIGGAALVRVHQQHPVARQEGRDPGAQLVHRHLERRDAHHERIIAMAQRVASDQRLASAAEELQCHAPSRAALGERLGRRRRAEGLDRLALVRSQLVVHLSDFFDDRRFGLQRESVVEELADGELRVLDVLAQVHLERHGGVDVARRPQAVVHDVYERAEVVGPHLAAAAVLGLSRVVGDRPRVIRCSRQEVHAVVAVARPLALLRIGLEREAHQSVLVEVVDEAALEQLLLGDDLVMPHGLAGGCRVMRDNLQLVAPAHLRGAEGCLALCVFSRFKQCELCERFLHGSRHPPGML